jgi:hypothetical protein
MAITKRPTITSAAELRSPDQERKIEAFISGAGKTGPEQAGAGEMKKKPTPVRFDPDMYPRIDAAAKRRGLSRAAWVRLVVSQALEAEDKSALISL